jgi:hypothetical protein
MGLVRDAAALTAISLFIVMVALWSGGSPALI